MSSAGFVGAAGANSSYSELNHLNFMMRAFMNNVRTAIPVKVIACTNLDTVTAVGTVDVLPLVNLMDGQNNGSPHATFYNIPYFRLQGGPNAIINDPMPDDIGWLIASDRDITTVKNTKAAANPDTPRRFNLSDGVYIGGFLNVLPTQYIQFTQDGNGTVTGITVKDVNNNTIVTSNTGISITDKNSNTLVMDTNGITINGVKFDRNQNVTGIKQLTTTDTTSLGGGSLAVKLSDGSNATKVKAT